MKVEMHEVESSNLAAAGYASGTLVIKFRNGGVYTYDGVEKPMFDELLAADSAGKFFHTNIRKAFAYKRHSNFMETGGTMEVYD